MTAVVPTTLVTALAVVTAATVVVTLPVVTAALALLELAVLRRLLAGRVAVGRLAGVHLGAIRGLGRGRVGLERDLGRLLRRLVLRVGGVTLGLSRRRGQRRVQRAPGGILGR